MQYKKGVSVQSTYEEIDFLPSDSVPSYDELIAGEVVDSRSLRLGVRSFHIGEDCGLMARTNIGKTSWVFQFSMCIALGYQNGPILSPEWELHQPMRVLYFAFEQNRKHIKKKYAHTIKSIPNLHVDVETSASDFQTMRRRIEKMQNEIGDRRLLVVFDNITKLKGSASDEKKAFFQWLEDYRRKCDINGKPITYLKVYHTQGAYKDYMAIEPTSNYGPKSDIYFTQDLVALGMCKEGNGSMRYLKELKNKYEDEKQSVSIFRYAGTEAPFYDYVGEATECDVLPSKDGRRGQVKSVAKESELAESSSGKRGRKEVYSLELLAEMYTERQSGLTWEKILANHGIDYDHNSKDGLKNKHKGIREAFRRHGLK